MHADWCDQRHRRAEGAARQGPSRLGREMLSAPTDVLWGVITPVAHVGGVPVEELLPFVYAGGTVWLFGRGWLAWGRRR